MSRFWRTLWNLLQVYPWQDHSPWEEEDTLRLKTFFASDVGVRLRTKLRNTSIIMNANSVQAGTEKACGQAIGYMLCLADLQALSGSSNQSNAAAEDGEEGDLANLEHMSP